MFYWDFLCFNQKPAFSCLSLFFPISPFSLTINLPARFSATRHGSPVCHHRKRSGFARAPVDRWTRPLRCSRNAPTARRATLPTRQGSRPQAAQRPGIARLQPHRLADRAPTWHRISPGARIYALMSRMFAATGETSRQSEVQRLRPRAGRSMDAPAAPGTRRRPGAQLCRRGKDRAHRPRSGPE